MRHLTCRVVLRPASPFRFSNSGPAAARADRGRCRTNRTRSNHPASAGCADGSRRSR